MSEQPPPARVVANGQVLARAIDDEMVLYHPATDAVTHLDAIAAQVWHELEHEVDVSDLVDELAGRFNADPGTIHDDVQKLLVELIDAELVRSI